MVTESAAAALPRIRIRESFGDRVFLIFVTAFLTIILLTVLYPLIYVISSSFSSGHAVTIGKVWLLPVEPTLHGYRDGVRIPTDPARLPEQRHLHRLRHADQRGHDYFDRLPAVAGATSTGAR